MINITTILIFLLWSLIVGLNIHIYVLERKLEKELREKEEKNNKTFNMQK